MIRPEHEWPVVRWCDCGRSRWLSFLRGAGLSFNCWTPNSSVLRRETKTFVASCQNLFMAGVLVWLTGSVIQKENLIGSLWCTQDSSSKRFCVPLFPQKQSRFPSFARLTCRMSTTWSPAPNPCATLLVLSTTDSKLILELSFGISTCHWFPWTHFWLALRMQIVLGQRLEK